VTAELRLGARVVVSRKRVQRLMRATGVSDLQKVKRGRTTIRVPGVRVADDLVERRFRPDRPDVLCVADITYLRTWAGWVYLAAVQDAYSRRIVGWSTAGHMRHDLVVDALQRAIARRWPAPGLIHHSDQARKRRSALRLEGPRRRHAVSRAPRAIASTTPSPSRSFDRQGGTHAPPLLADAPRAHQRVFEFVEAFYNTTRRHSTLAYLSPAQFEAITETTANKENG
jgi:transposase InsO family protein